MGRDKIRFKEELKILLNNQSYIKNIIENIYSYSSEESKEELKYLASFTKKNNLKDAYPWVSYNLGYIYICEGKIKKANDYVIEAYNIFNEKGDEEGLLSIYSLLFSIRIMEKNFSEAVRYCLKGLELAQEKKNIEREIIYKLNIAVIYMEIEEYQKALDLSMEVEELSWVGNSTNKITYYLNMAHCEIKLNKIDEAIRCFKEVEALIVEDTIFQQKWALLLGEIKWKLGSYDEARKLYNDLVMKNTNSEIEEEIIIALSEIDIKEEKYNDAIKRILTIVDRVEKEDIFSNVKRVYKILSIAYKNVGDYENAYIYLEKYMIIERRLENIKSDVAIKTIDFEKKEMEEENYKLLYNQNKLLYEVGQNLTSNLEKNGVYNAIAEQLNKLIKYDILQIMSYNEKEDVFQYKFILENRKALDIGTVEVHKNSFASYCINNKEEIVMSNIENKLYKYIKDIDSYVKIVNSINKNKRKPKSLMMTPMIINEKVIGVLCVQSYEESFYTKKELVIMKGLSTYMAIALENARLYENVQYNANYDELTQIYNRRKVLYKGNELFHKKEQDYYIAMVDIDNFKKINDAHGHVIGDQVLKKVAKVMKNTLSKDDIIGRYGGEEFIIFVRDNKDIKAILEKVRRSVEELIIYNNDNCRVSVTISVGVTKMDNSKETLEGNIALADELLYIAKSTGKNRVVFQ